MHQGGEITTQTASLQQYLDFKTDNLPEIALLERYGVKSKRTNLCANEHEHLYQNLPCLLIFKSNRRVNHELDPDLRVFARTKVGKAWPIIQSSRANVVIQTSRFSCFCACSCYTYAAQSMQC